MLNGVQMFGFDDEGLRSRAILFVALTQVFVGTADFRYFHGGKIYQVVISQIRVLVFHIVDN